MQDLRPNSDWSGKKESKLILAATHGNASRINIKNRRVDRETGIWTEDDRKKIMTQCLHLIGCRGDVTKTAKSSGIDVQTSEILLTMRIA